ncbi:discoidin domain-containing protein [Streptomyces tsukubensis]|uniref:discoidin domain-containing protein n=1 Tax=Streptomyces tsukubensis TaxID=83656 RepID=UPI001D059A86|nr:discoidin domain-containing protein [Streptomyces tsukubensis]
MTPHPAGLDRRRFVQFLGASGALSALPLTAGASAASAAAGPGTSAPSGAKATSIADDAVARTYHRVLLTHTHWSEQQWDAAKGYYTEKDFGFAVVLGHAVLLTRDGFDAEAAGVDKKTLRERTLATIKHFAASNRLTGGDQWGRTLFFDTTFQSYFVLAARLLWSELDATTRGHVDTIAREQAAYTEGLGTGDDPDSGDWTPNGLTGGHVGDTKLEEMGVYAQSLAPGLAWAPDDKRHADWSAAFGRWSRNETGLPAADRANPAVVDGVAVSENTAQNLYDTFIVENHMSFGPHYQEELWRTSGRNAAHFLTAGKPLPEVLTAQPNAGPLWRTLLGVMSDAGEPLMPMVADREHLYGRDVIPLAFLAQVTGDRAAARAETALAERLEAYQKYPPEYRIAKFSGEPKYEPEARAEVAISYLLHEWRAAHGDPVRPLSERELFTSAGGATDYGTGPGLLSHQSAGAWAGAVSKPGFVKFAWQPAHDDWLFALSGATPMFLPSTGGKISRRTATTYRRIRDGFDGSASLYALDGGYAGFTTLPSGAVVYATTGTAQGEGHLEVHNLTMPGVPGLDGGRTYTTAEGSVTVAAQDAGGPGGAKAGPRTDTLTFPRATFSHLRMLGVNPAPTYGYSLFSFEAWDGADGVDLAAGGEATASSADEGKGPALAVDGDAATRWAVSRADRTKADSWFAVDLGEPRALDRVTLKWEAAAGRGYRIQGSSDGTAWTDLVAYPHAQLSSEGGWISVDGRAGLVVRGGEHPLAVYGDTVVLSDGPARPLLVEGLPDGAPKSVRAAARRTPPRTDDPHVRAALTDGHLSLFNLSGTDVTSTVALPGERDRVDLYAGVQTITADGTDYRAELAASSAAVEPPRLTLRPTRSGRLPEGLRAEVTDGATVRLSGASCRVTLTAPGGGRTEATVRAGRTTEVTVRGATAHPLTDLALGRNVFPNAPLPRTMTDPSAAVDGDPHTAWRPGAEGRLVVDLGESRRVTEIVAEWTGGRPPACSVEFSEDGLTYRGGSALRSRGSRSTQRTSATARYVALSVRGWTRKHGSLGSLSVR